MPAVRNIIGGIYAHMMEGGRFREDAFQPTDRYRETIRPVWYEVILPADEVKALHADALDYRQLTAAFELLLIKHGLMAPLIKYGHTHRTFCDTETGAVHFMVSKEGMEIMRNCRFHGLPISLQNYDLLIEGKTLPGQQMEGELHDGFNWAEKLMKARRREKPHGINPQ